MIRVTHLFPHLLPGGAERMVVHLMSHLNRERFHISAICLAGPMGTDLERLLENSEIPVEYLGKRPGFDPRMFSRLGRALRKAAPDILHTHVHVLRYALPYILRARLRKRPAMLHTVHSLAEFEVEPRARWIQKVAFKCGVVPVSVGQEVSLSLDRMYGVQNSAVVPNCVPVGRYRSPENIPSEWRRSAGFAESDFLFVCVAGLRPEKNHSFLIEAFARVAAQRQGVYLVLAGGGDHSKLRDLAQRLGVGEKVRFLGVRTDVPDILAASDTFVLASKYEGNPLCVMEAMAAGLPVIAPRVGGIPELVTSGAEGILVSPGDLDQFSREMERILLDAASRWRMGAASGKRALRSFDIPIMTRGYETLYDSLLDTLRSPHREEGEGVSQVTTI